MLLSTSFNLCPLISRNSKFGTFSAMSSNDFIGLYAIESFNNDDKKGNIPKFVNLFVDKSNEVKDGNNDNWVSSSLPRLLELRFNSLILGRWGKPYYRELLYKVLALNL